MEGSTGPPVTNPARSLPVQDSASVDDSGKRLVVDNSNHSHVFIDLSDPAPHHPQLTPICSPSENNPGSVPTVMVGTSKNEASTKVRTPASTRASDAANPEAKFDPRVAAAELKKKLLKDKSARDNSIRPLGEVSHTSAQPDKRSVSDSATPSTRVSHAPGGKPARDPVFAGAEDIVDLIKSFSRATNQDNQVQPMGKTTQPMGKTTQPIGKTTQPIGKTIQPGNSTVNVTHVNAKSGTSAASHHQKIPVIDSVPTGPSGKRGQRARTMQGRLSLQANHGDAVPGSSLSGVTNTPIRTGATQAATASADKSSTTDLRTTTSIPNKPKATVTQSGYHNGYGSIAQDKPPTSSSNLGRSNKAMDTTPAATPKQPNSTDGARGNNNVEEAQTMGATLAKLIEQDHELRDWLLYTGYFDMDARTKKLARYRMLAELEATEQRIKEEQERLAATRRKLLEEDGLDQSYRLDVQIPGAGHSMTPQTSTPSSPVTNVSSVKLPQGKQPSKLSEDTTTPRSSLKRGLGILDAEDQRSKMPRLDPDVAKDSKANGAEDIVQRADRDRGRDGNRDHPDTWRSRSRPFKRGESSHRHSSFGPLDDKYEKYDLDYDDKNYDHRGSYHGDTGRYDAYRGKGKRGFWRRSPSPRRGYDRLQVTDPKPIDLGGKGATRFFMVKSFNEENVTACMEDGIWTTMAKNTDTLTRAFAQCRNVILFFSINKSRAFQGYARMTTAPNEFTPRPRWIQGLHWETSPPFDVEWLSTTEVEFCHISYLLNPLNDNLPALVGKDGQEIGEECGRRLLKAMEGIARSKNEQAGYDRGPPGGPRADRGRGGYTIRGRDHKDIKREER